MLRRRTGAIVRALHRRARVRRLRGRQQPAVLPHPTLQALQAFDSRTPGGVRDSDSPTELMHRQLILSVSST